MKSKYIGITMNSKFLYNITYSIIKSLYLRERLISEYQTFLEKTQWWSPSELKCYQEKKLKGLIKHAYENVPYYHKLFRKLNLKPDDIKRQSDLKKLPILTKDIIRNNLNELTAGNYTKGQLIKSFTGGYTGKRMKFFIDDRWFARNKATAHREWRWAGYERGDKIVYLWSAPQDLSIHARQKTRMFNFIMQMKFLDAYDLSDSTLKKYTNFLKRFKPKTINAYSSAISLMAQYVENKGISGIEPDAVLTSCEMLFDPQRKLIESAFNTEVFDYYSGRDTSLHAAECPEHSGYHLSVENAMVEFMINNEHVSAGEIGKLIITDFYNYATPFIRYEIGDLGVPSEDMCPCKRGLPLMDKIVGRTSDMVITKNGQYVPSLFFIHIFDTDAIEKYQFVQKTKDYAILKIVKGKKYSYEDLKKIIQMIQEKCGDIKIDVEFVQSIPLTNSGKYQFIVSEVEMKI